MNFAFKYKAFISYSHKDERWAKRLHRRLETYKLPADVSERFKYRRPLSSVFRDREELSVGSDLSAVIVDALNQSETLIVICSPDSAQSKWVNQEIRHFKALGRAAKIFPIIIAGKPFDDEEECFPKSLLYEIDAFGLLTDEFAEPLAADLRANSDGWRLGTLKLIAGILNLPLDHLVQRDNQRARRRLLTLASSAVLMALIMAGLTVKSVSSEREAEARRADAENLIEFMLGDLKERLEPVGRLDVLEAVGDKTFQYYEQFELSENDPVVNGRHARSMHLIGEVLDKVGNHDESAFYFNKAYKITDIQSKQFPANADRVFEHAQSLFWLSVPARRASRNEDERAYHDQTIELIERLQNIEGNTARVSELCLKTFLNAGRVSYRLGDKMLSKTQLEQALKCANLFPKSDKPIAISLLQAETLSWLGELYRSNHDYTLSYEIRRQQVEILQLLRQTHPDDFRVLEALIYGQIGLGNAARYVGQFDQSFLVQETALKNNALALQREPERDKMRKARSSILQSLLLTALESGQAELYPKYRSQLTPYLNPEPMRTELDNYWDGILTDTTFDLDIKHAVISGRLNAALNILEDYEGWADDSRVKNLPSAKRIAHRLEFYKAFVRNDPTAITSLKNQFENGEINRADISLYPAVKYLIEGTQIDLEQYPPNISALYQALFYQNP